MQFVHNVKTKNYGVFSNFVFCSCLWWWYWWWQCWCYEKCAIQFQGTILLVSRANSTAPWNQFHDVCGVGLRSQFHSTLKPISRSRGILLWSKTAIPRSRWIITTTNWANSTDILKKFHGAMELVSQIPQTRGINSTALLNFTHNIFVIRAH